MENAATHLSRDDIVRYRERTLPPKELLAADSHLALCDICHGRLIECPGLSEKVGAAGRAFDDSATAEIAHLTYEQLAALVDDEIREIDREILVSHLELCPSCEAELNDLREVRFRMATHTNERPANTPTSKSSLRERVLSFRLPAFGLTALAGLATVAIFSFLINLPLRKEISDARARVAELERINASLKERIADIDSLQAEVATLRQDNERLRVAAEGQALVSLNDAGGQIILDAQGNLSGIQAASRYEQAIKEALQTERVKLPASLRELRGSSGTMMGASPSGFDLIAPVGVVVETDRPTFRWSPLEGAMGYTVAVYDEALVRVATGEAGAATSWTVSDPLPRGKTYIWQVRAVKDGQEVVAPPPSHSKIRFKVLEASKLDEIKRARDAHSSSHLAMGIIYAEAGLVDEAQREFAELVKVNPQSPVVRKLLRSVQAPRK